MGSIVEFLQWPGLVAGLTTAIVLPGLFGMLASSIFIAPKPTFRALAMVLFKSRTVWWGVAWWTAVTVCAVVQLSSDNVVMRVSAFYFGPFVVLGLAIPLFRGAFSVWNVNRQQPYFEGLSEKELVAADVAFPNWPTHDYPEPKAIFNSAEAARYSRRAESAARARDWISASLLLLATSFVGPAWTWFFASPGPSALWAFAILGVAAVGFGIQRRASHYRKLAAQLLLRSAELDRLENRAPTWLSVALQRFGRSIKELSAN